MRVSTCPIALSVTCGELGKRQEEACISSFSPSAWRDWHDRIPPLVVGSRLCLRSHAP